MESRHEDILFEGMAIPLYSANTLVIGSGAAGLNAAVRLVRNGVADVLLVTEKWGAGTSFNAGSDKQTYYKLSLGGEALDAPRRMADDLFAGGSMHGDHALCEANLSAECFHHLVQLGVPFPYSPWGAHVGYRTDHDPRGRATSAGPCTSRIMGERLGREVKRLGVPVLNRHMVVSVSYTHLTLPTN